MQLGSIEAGVSLAAAAACNPLRQSAKPTLYAALDPNFTLQAVRIHYSIRRRAPVYQSNFDLIFF